MCVCERESERERVCVYVCVCAREREKRMASTNKYSGMRREGGREGGRERWVGRWCMAFRQYKYIKFTDRRGKGIDS